MTRLMTPTADTASATMPVEASKVLFNTIYIVGRNIQNNIMLGHFLRSELCATCNCHKEIPLEDVGAETADSKVCILQDCMDLDIAHIDRSICPDDKQAHDLPIVLYNVSSNLNLDQLVEKYDVRGIFFNKDDRSTFVSGMQKIADGKKWGLGKKPLKALEPATGGGGYGQPMQKVSKREAEILKQVAAGMSNKQISEAFGISLHTVKTHVYNIYKKINVPNRLQAALWATAHLPGKIEPKVK